MINGNRVLCSVLRVFSVAAFVSCCLVAMASAGEPRHGISAFGDLKYAADFQHFDYVNPNAPKGGRISMIGTAGLVTFDSFNPYIINGDPAQGLEFVFETLMTRALDEPDAVYALVARTAEIADDKMSITFRLDPNAKFSDGTLVRASDVVFSFDAIKKDGSPIYSAALRDVVKAEALDELTVHYAFTGTTVRDLPLIVAGLPILSAKYYEARKFDETTLDPPVGSGPYEVGAFSAGSYVVYKRRDDYWGNDLPVNRGRFNFDELRYEYFRDRTAELQNLLSGTFDLREEFTSVDWATSYNVAAVKDGRIVRATLPNDEPSGAQGFFINTRRNKFKDPRVREALGLAFDFEWSNRKLFYELYERTASFFENSPLKAKGLPSAAELALLKPFRKELRKAVFGKPYTPPKSDGSGRDRKLLRRANNLLNAAGWKLKGRNRVNKHGRILRVEILTYSPSFERVINPYISNLKRLGIKASLRMVDPSQYQRRVKSFDFDLTTSRYVLRLTPGAEMRTYWGSANANVEGSFNLSGVADPVVDALIDKAMAATSRDELTTAIHALDRVLRAGHYWIPQWFKASHNVAYWDKFSAPEVKPKYDRGIIAMWWYDPDKEAALKQKSQ